MRGGLTARMMIASALLAILVAGAFVALLLALAEERESTDRSRESQAVLVAANRLERLAVDLETGERGFVLTGEERYLEPWNAARNALPEAGAELQRLVELPVQRARTQQILEALASYLRDHSEPVVEAARRGDAIARSGTTTEDGKRRVDALRAQFDALLSTERTIATTRQEQARGATRRALLAAIGGLAGSVVLIALFGGYLTRAIVLPVRRASAMAGRLAGGDLSVRMPETAAGEIGALERSFNSMGSSLETSRIELGLLLDQQAALRRVAMLVAHGVSPEEVFDAVTLEVGRLLGADSTRLLRYDPDGMTTVVAARSQPGVAITIGTRLAVEGDNIPALVLHSGRPARMETLEGASGRAAALLRQLGIRSAVGAPIVVEGRLWGVVVAAWTKPVAVSEEHETRIAEFTELVGTAIANAESRAQLQASRARVVAAGDETRRRIERDLHDGIQQRLVALGLELRAIEATLPVRPDQVKAQLGHAAKGLTAAIEELQAVSRGIHPAILSRGGLAPALKALARRAAVPVELDVGPPRRLPERVEVAAYYVVSEALTNAAKHARASVVEVCVEDRGDLLRVSVADDGIGGADPNRGSGLVGLRDRVEALGGRLDVTSAPGRGTSLEVTIPVGSG
ncbi:MAG: CHASE3 domain-containing protein [Actinomycetota bacterium]|nr:CHASE3 domain-containing protein [Actinomycetota bacterium]